MVVAGPTASGKSEFALSLCKKIKGVIINFDSMQVYKELRILSARPEKSEEKIVDHKLYGYMSGKNRCSAFMWCESALCEINAALKKSSIPILVGGTGLYFKSLLNGLVNIPNIPIRSRNKIRSLHKDLGQKNFYKKLLKLDPKSKNKINSTDSQRSIRAYEVKYFTKKSIHDWFKETKSKFKKNEFLKIYIDFPRSELIQRINKRTEQMIKDGAVEEVKRFIKQNVRKSNSANKAIGIAEINRYLNNEKDLEYIKQEISIKTRQYAKRQRTWARGYMMNWLKLEPRDINKFLKKI